MSLSESDKLSCNGNSGKGIADEKRHYGKPRPEEKDSNCSRRGKKRVQRKKQNGVNDENSHGQAAETADICTQRILYRKPEKEGKQQTVPDNGGKIVIKMFRQPAVYEVKPHFLFRGIAGQSKNKQEYSVDREGQLLYSLFFKGKKAAG